MESVVKYKHHELKLRDNVCIISPQQSILKHGAKIFGIALSFTNLLFKNFVVFWDFTCHTHKYTGSFAHYSLAKCTAGTFLVSIVQFKNITAHLYNS